MFPCTHTKLCCSYLGLETFGTLSKNICTVYCGQTWVISACVSSWKIKKRKPELKLSAEFISSGTDLWQMQSRGLFFSPSEQTEGNHSWRKAMLQNTCYALWPIWHSIQGEALLQKCGVTTIHTHSPATTVIKIHEKWWEDAFEYLLSYAYTSI